jgi:hypothetical protein
VKRTVGIFGVVFCLLTAAAAQHPEVTSVQTTISAGDLMTLNVEDIEAEINYSETAFVTAVIKRCQALNWSYRLDWADGQITPPSSDNTVSHINDKGYRLRDLGTYALGFSHEYKTANTTPGYNVVLHNEGQCAGFDFPRGVFHDTFSQLLRVWGRIPVDTVTLNPSTAKRGTAVTVDILLNANAPPSGTRVFLTFPEGIFANAPQYLVVPAGTSEIKPVFMLTATAQLGGQQIGAWTAQVQKVHPPSSTLTIVR